MVSVLIDGSTNKVLSRGTLTICNTIQVKLQIWDSQSNEYNKYIYKKVTCKVKNKEENL